MALRPLLEVRHFKSKVITRNGGAPLARAPPAGRLTVTDRPTCKLPKEKFKVVCTLCPAPENALEVFRRKQVALLQRLWADLLRDALLGKFRVVR